MPVVEGPFHGGQALDKVSGLRAQRKEDPDRPRKRRLRAALKSPPAGAQDSRSEASLSSAKRLSGSSSLGLLGRAKVARAPHPSTTVLEKDSCPMLVGRSILAAAAFQAAPARRRKSSNQARAG